MSMGLRKGPILPTVQTNGAYKSPVKNREVQLSSVRSHDCRGGMMAPARTFAVTAWLGSGVIKPELEVQKNTEPSPPRDSNK